MLCANTFVRVVVFEHMHANRRIQVLQMGVLYIGPIVRATLLPSNVVCGLFCYQLIVFGML